MGAVAQTTAPPETHRRAGALWRRAVLAVMPLERLHNIRPPSAPEKAADSPGVLCRFKIKDNSQRKARLLTSNKGAIQRRLT
jgi:hypothetical protein